MGVIELWTLVAIILHFAGVENFKDWPVAAFPTEWSCMCIEFWALMAYASVALIAILAALFVSKR